MKLTHTLFTALPLPGAARAQWVVGVVLLAILGGGVARAQVTTRVSVATGGAQANQSCVRASISAEGRFVAFNSPASTLVAGDTNNVNDVFVRDRTSGTTERVSVSTGGAQTISGFTTQNASISADGRFVAFESDATNLVAGDTNGYRDVFVRDRQSATTERVSVATGGAEGIYQSQFASLSADGRFVAFQSAADNLVAGDTNLAFDVFVHDRTSGTTERVSIDSGGVQGNQTSGGAGISISADGRFVAFESLATNLVANETNGGARDVFVRDRTSGTTERASVDTAGAQGNGDSYTPSISADGRFVAFFSGSFNFAGSTNLSPDIFVRDRQNGTTELVSLATGGAQGDSYSEYPSISADGRFVAFQSNATNLVANDTSGFRDVFVRDRQSGTTVRVSVDSSGAQGNAMSLGCSISADGRFVAFESEATNLVAGDTNGKKDIFAHDRNPSGFTSFCDPGVGGVIPCPCANPPSGPGRGCDNSSATGGASLTASGVAYLSSDSIVFTTSGEKPTATSIVLQGTSAAGAGLVFGQGVRCVNGTLKRLYVKTAVAGTITAPDFGAGDPSVSVRSTALGDTILVGESRWYTVYYRDPVVLGGCPAASTFNVTQSGIVTWWP